MLVPLYDKWKNDTQKDCIFHEKFFQLMSYQIKNIHYFNGHIKGDYIYLATI